MAITADVLVTDTGAQEGEQGLAFFEPGFIDPFPDSYRRSALGFVSLLGLDLQADLVTVYKAGLEESLQQMDEAIKQSPGGIILKFASDMRKFARADAMIHDYGLDETDDAFVLGIPAAVITGGTSLPHPQTHTSNLYRPVMNLRVQTSSDKPLKIYAGPGKIEDIQSPGTWHTFPLDALEVVGITE